MAKSSTTIELSVKPTIDGAALRKALADELRRLADDIEKPKPSINFGTVTLHSGDPYGARGK